MVKSVSVSVDWLHGTHVLTLFPSFSRSLPSSSPPLRLVLGEVELALQKGLSSVATTKRTGLDSYHSAIPQNFGVAKGSSNHPIPLFCLEETGPRPCITAVSSHKLSCILFPPLCWCVPCFMTWNRKNWEWCDEKHRQVLLLLLLFMSSVLTPTSGQGSAFPASLCTVPTSCPHICFLSLGHFNFH